MRWKWLHGLRLHIVCHRDCSSVRLTVDLNNSVSMRNGPSLWLEKSHRCACLGDMQTTRQGDDHLCGVKVERGEPGGLQVAPL